MGAPILLGILFFFVLCLGAADSIKGTVMVVAVFTLFIIAARFKVLRDRVHWPFIALTLVVLMDGISTFYAVSGKFALREFLKVFLAYLMAVILLATSPKKEETTGKRIATILAVATAVGSLVGIDSISTGWISGVVVWVLKHFTEAYDSRGALEYFSNAVRLASFFDNANVFAGVTGLGVILCMGLTDTSNRQKERCFFLVMLFLNTVAFILTVSLGAFVFAFFALVSYCFIQKKTDSSRSLALIVEALVLAAIAAMLIYRLSTWSTNRFYRLPIALLGAAVLCLVDSFIVQRITGKVTVNRKHTAIAGIAIIVLVIIYAVASLRTIGSITLAPNEATSRMVFSRPGTYSMNVQADGEALSLTVKSASWAEIASKTSNTIYEGSAFDAVFTVPEGSKMVLLEFSAPEEIQISTAKFGNYRVPLSYKLLPRFVGNRLINVGSIINMAQRLVYFQDGLRLFKRSPIVGLGIGAFENAIKSVQSFYYETKYAHNHYFQTMLETGIIGLLLFLVLLVSSAAAIWRSRKIQPFAPMLSALWVFMAGQAIHDIVFSAYAYLPIAYGSFAMINLCCGQEIKKPKLTNTFKTVAIVVSSVCIVVYCGFLAGNLMAKRNMEKNATMQTLVQSVKLDRFEWADYALAYVTNAMGDNVNPYVRQQADEYAERLAEVNSNTIPIYLAEYYFQSDRSEQGIDMLRKYVDYVSSDQSAWRNAFTVLRTYDDGSETFQSGAVQLADMLETWNNENLGTITLDDETNAYIAAYRQ